MTSPRAARTFTTPRDMPPPPTATVHDVLYEGEECSFDTPVVPRKPRPAGGGLIRQRSQSHDSIPEADRISAGGYSPAWRRPAILIMPPLPTQPSSRRQRVSLIMPFRTKNSFSIDVAMLERDRSKSDTPRPLVVRRTASFEDPITGQRLTPDEYASYCHDKNPRIPSYSNKWSLYPGNF